MRAAPRIRFDRHELAGAFGDLGTDLPLIVGMVLVAGLDPASVLITFGLMQVLTALRYGIPMPVQPLKLVAVLVIAGKVDAATLAGGGIAIGLLMLLLTVSGALVWLARIVPAAVVRGLQVGLALSLAQVAFKDLLPSEGAAGGVLAAFAGLTALLLTGRRALPPALAVVAMGVVYAFATRITPETLLAGAGLALPVPRAIHWSDVLTGALVVALPQIPLSLGNSVLATRKLAADLFPERAPGVRGLGFTYAGMNLVAPWLGGIPVCHGSGGLAGHWAFGGRTGGSVLLYGSLFLVLGLAFSRGFHDVVQVFPRPVLGVLLAFEAWALLRLARDAASRPADFATATFAALCAWGLPYGYVVALVAGTLLHRVLEGRGALATGLGTREPQAPPSIRPD